MNEKEISDYIFSLLEIGNMDKIKILDMAERESGKPRATIRRIMRAIRLNLEKKVNILSNGACENVMGSIEKIDIEAKP